jgi:hypothetical protein
MPGVCADGPGDDKHVLIKNPSIPHGVAADPNLIRCLRVLDQMFKNIDALGCVVICRGGALSRI